jgi:hypothetical protein
MNRFNSDQNCILEYFFEKDNYPKNVILAKIAEETKLNLVQVENWFMRKRKQKSKQDILSLTDKEYLKIQFENNSNPSLDMLVEFSNKIKKPYIKIRDWFETQLLINQYNNLDVFQKVFLEKQFEINKSPTNPTIYLISKTINMHTVVVKDWFANRLVEHNKMFGRTRVTLNTQQLHTLLSHFLLNMYPDYRELYDIAVKTCLTIGQVKNWFQNRRKKRNQSQSRIN